MRPPPKASAFAQLAASAQGRWLLAGGAAVTAALLLGLYISTIQQLVHRGERMRAAQRHAAPVDTAHAVDRALVSARSDTQSAQRLMARHPAALESRVIASGL